MADTIRLDARGWTHALEELGGPKSAAVCARALNRSIVTGRSVMLKHVASDTGLRQTTIRRQFRTEQAKPAHLVARLTASGARIPVIEFSARGREPSRGKGRGVTARVTTSTRSRYPRAFIATMPSGHRGVYERSGTGRLPIHELFGPSIPHVFTKHLPIGLVAATTALQTNLEREFTYALSQMRS